MQIFPDPLLAENPGAWSAEQRAAAHEWFARKYPARGDKTVTIVLSRIHPDDAK